MTLLAQEPGAQAAYNNPAIDEIKLDKIDHTTDMAALARRWYDMGQQYDRFVPLAHLVEGTLITVPQMAQFHARPAGRHLLCNRNYLEMLHLSAGVPHDPQVHFYPYEYELAKMKAWRESLNAKRVLMLVTHGSGPQKIWPHTKEFIGKALKKYPDLHIVLTGEERGKEFEKPWTSNPRVHCTCTKWTLREFLTMPFVVDALLGPETGVFYAASQMALPKILMLSHGSVENTSRDWINTRSLWAKHVDCKGRGRNEAPACHQIHDTWAHCTRITDPNCLYCRRGSCSIHLSACQQAIKPAMALHALEEVFDERLAPAHA